MGNSEDLGFFLQVSVLPQLFGVIFNQLATSFPGGKALKDSNQAYWPQQRIGVHANPVDFTDNALVSGGTEGYVGHSEEV